ncbi:hypothetical protein [Microcoleus sp.]|uniref:hypothetical protein n=1 Tax=Microcoleus sp. TaxID=44472 RepID=UPI00403E8297
MADFPLGQSENKPSEARKCPKFRTLSSFVQSELQPQMEKFTSEENLAIRDYFCVPDYPQPHGEVVASQLLSAMINSGKYKLEEYPMLAEAAIKLTAILAVRFHNEVKHEVQETTTPKPLASEKDSMNSDTEAYDPIPF